jgi:hypothetical protein
LDTRQTPATTCGDLAAIGLNSLGRSETAATLARDLGPPIIDAVFSAAAVAMQKVVGSSPIIRF